MNRAKLVKLCKILKCSDQGLNFVLIKRINNSTEEPCLKYFNTTTTIKLTSYGKKVLNGEIDVEKKKKENIYQW